MRANNARTDNGEKRNTHERMDQDPVEPRTGQQDAQHRGCEEIEGAEGEARKETHPESMNEVSGGNDHHMDIDTKNGGEIEEPELEPRKETEPEGKHDVGGVKGHRMDIEMDTADQERERRIDAAEGSGDRVNTDAYSGLSPSIDALHISSDDSQDQEEDELEEDVAEPENPRTGRKVGVRPGFYTYH